MSKYSHTTTAAVERIDTPLALAYWAREAVESGNVERARRLGEHGLAEGLARLVTPAAGKVYEVVYDNAKLAPYQVSFAWTAGKAVDAWRVRAGLI